MSIPGSRRALSFHWVARWLFATLTLVTSVSRGGEQLLPPLPGMAPYSLRAAPAPRYTRAPDGEGRFRVTTDFHDHDGQPLHLTFSMLEGVSLASMQQFGFAQAELLALHQACLRKGTCDQAEFDRRLQQYYRDHGLRVRQIAGRPARLTVDIASVVRRSRAQIEPLAAALRDLRDKRGLDADALMSTAAALVQGGMEYRSPEPLEDGRQTLGFYTPPRALEKGYGDCDTKSALLAAILANLGEQRIIGVRVPDHYLLGVARPARAGEVHLGFNGDDYVLIEAAGPAQRRPGEIGKQTRLALAEGRDIRIDPIF